MKYYEVNRSFEPKVIGVKHGVYQLEIDEKAIGHSPSYEEFKSFFSSRNSDFWKSQDKLNSLNPPTIYGKMLKNAKITDVMGYAPSFRFLDNVYSQKFIDIIKTFDIGAYQTFDFKMNDVPSKYFLLFIETISNEKIDFEKSSVITGHKALNNIKHHSISDSKEYVQFLNSNPLATFEKIAIDKEHFGKDIISIQAIPNNFYSEKLVDFLLDCGITGLQVGYNNSVQLEFV